jgi:hypothetical protein
LEGTRWNQRWAAIRVPLITTAEATSLRVTRSLRVDVVDELDVAFAQLNVSNTKPPRPPGDAFRRLAIRWAQTGAPGRRRCALRDLIR